MLKCVLIRISYSVYTTATTKWHHCHALLYDALVQWMHGCYTLVWFLSHIIWSGELERIWLTYHLLKVYEMAMVRFLEGGITATLVRCIKAYSVSCCGNHFLLMIHLRTLRLLILRRWFWRSRSQWLTNWSDELERICICWRSTKWQWFDFLKVCHGVWIGTW